MFFPVYFSLREANIEGQKWKQGHTDANKQISVVIIGNSTLKQIMVGKFPRDWNPFTKCMLSIFQLHEQGA